MTGREKILTAWKGGRPKKRIPLWEFEFELFDHYAKKPLILGQKFADLTAKEQEKALWQNAESMVSVAEQFGHSALTCLYGYWEIAPGIGTSHYLPGDGPHRLLPVLRKVAGNNLALVMFTDGMIMSPIGNDYESFCYRLYDAPEEIDQMAKDALNRGLDEARRARDLGADAVCNACDIADNHGVFFSPPHLDRFWLPFFYRWTSAVREMGLVSILHSDGNLNSILDKLANSDLHALQSIDPTAGMDIIEAKAEVGDRLCLCGNIDIALLQVGPPEKIAEETTRICQALNGREGFVLGASNAVISEIPPAHYDAMLGAWREHGEHSAPEILR